MSIKTKITDCNIGEYHYELKLVSDHKKVDKDGKETEEWKKRKIASHLVEMNENTYVVLKCEKQSNVQSSATELSTEDVTDEIKAALGIV